MRRKMALFTMMIMLLYMPPSSSEIMDRQWKGVSWLLGLYGYDLDQNIEKGMRSNFHPVRYDCGDVQIELREVLYDGAWMYTAAIAFPTRPESTILVPSSASIDDFISGGYGERNRNDQRTFLEAAREERKDLLLIEATPTEYAEAALFFTDHRQDAGDQSTLFSGAPLILGDGVSTIHFSVQVSRISPVTGEEVSSASFDFPVGIWKLPSQQRTYVASNPQLPFHEVTLKCSPLATHVFPNWHVQGMDETTTYQIMDMEGIQYPKGLPEDSTTYYFEELPQSLLIRMAWKDHAPETHLFISK